MSELYLVCGPSGCGKTWVCEQLRDRFCYIPHDKYPAAEYEGVLENRLKRTSGRILGEAPFRVSVLINNLRAKGYKVHPVFIVESQNTVVSRIIERDGPSGLTKRRLTRIATLAKRAEQMGEFNGTAQEVLDFLGAL